MIFLMLATQMTRRTFVSSKKSVGLFDNPLVLLPDFLSAYLQLKSLII
jgi:hypothetical protein